MKGALFEERFALALAAPSEPIDWRDTARYEFVHTLSNQQLAWEFLRRSPEYRADFDEWFSRWQALTQSGRSESYSDWRPVQEHMEALCDKWSLWAVHGLGVPTSSLPPEFRDVQTLRGPIPVSSCFEREQRGDHAARLEDYAPSVTLRFHLDQPIKKQLALAEGMLLRLAEMNGIKPPRLEREDKRPSRQNVARYVQILDAKLDNRTLTEIAKALYGDTRAAYDKARDHLDAALKLAGSGYLGIYRSPQR